MAEIPTGLSLYIKKPGIADPEDTVNSYRGLNIAFYVTGRATRLIHLLEKNSTVFGSTRLVVNDNGPNDLLRTHLEKRSIPYIEYNYAELGIKGKNRNHYVSDLLLEEFVKENIDYCFCFGFLILKGDLLNRYKNRIINFHPSLLPAFPGAYAIDQALASSAFLIGNTAHFVDENVDHGPVILQSIVHSNLYTTYNDVLNLQEDMLEQIFKWLVEGRLMVSGEKVSITNADYSKVVFYPELDK